MRSSLWIGGLLALLAISACSDTGPTPNYYQAIPANSTVVITMDFTALAQKGKVTNPQDLKPIAAVMEELRNEDRTMAEFFEELMANPAAKGLDITQPAAFSIISGRGENGVVVMPLLSGDTFEETLKTISEAAELDYQTSPVAGGHIYLAEEEDILVAWNDSYMVATSATPWGKAPADVAVALLSGEGGITANEDFNAFVKEPGEIKMWMSMATAVQMAAEENPQAAMAARAIPYEYVHANLRFEEGAAVFSVVPSGATGNTSTLDNMLQSPARATGNVIPAETKVALRFAINPETLLEALQSNPMTSSMLNRPEAVMVLGRSVPEAIQKLEGTFAMGIHGASADTGEPLGVIAVEWKDDEVYNHLASYILATIAQDMGDYKRVIQDDMTIYFSLEGNTLVATNDEALIRDIVDGGLSDSFDWHADGGEVYVNLELGRYSPAMRAGMNLDDLGPGQVFMEMLREIIITGTTQEGELRVNMMDEDTNSLETILKVVEDNYQQLAM